MHIKIAKGTSESRIRKILSTIPKKKQVSKTEAFFGKLPGLEDGLAFQKKIRKGCLYLLQPKRKIIASKEKNKFNAF